MSSEMHHRQLLYVQCSLAMKNVPVEVKHLLQRILNARLFQGKFFIAKLQLHSECEVI